MNNRQKKDLMDLIERNTPRYRYGMAGGQQMFDHINSIASDKKKAAQELISCFHCRTSDILQGSPSAVAAIKLERAKHFRTLATIKSRKQETSK